MDYKLSQWIRDGPHKGHDVMNHNPITTVYMDCKLPQEAHVRARHP